MVERDLAHRQHDVSMNEIDRGLLAEDPELLLAHPSPNVGKDEFTDRLQHPR